MKIKHHIIPIFVPHVGCPHDCVFCNQKKITGRSTDVISDEVDNTIKSYLKTIPKSNEKLEVAFYGGSFTAIDVDIQKELLGIANSYKSRGLIDRIRLSTRPDCIDQGILNLLKENDVDIIELGVQSLDKEVLACSNRGHSKEDVYTSVNLIKSYGFKLGLQMMLGLPEDTKDKAICTAKQIVSMKPDFARIYPTLVIKDTYLEKLYESGEYDALSVEEAVDLSSIILMMFELKKINVIRIGLQPTENIATGSDELIAGPFHPSFRQLVESKVYGLILESFLDDAESIGSHITIYVSKKEISNIVGQRSRNIEKIKNKYNIKKVTITGLDIPKDSFYIADGKEKFEIDKNVYMKKYLKSKNYL